MSRIFLYYLAPVLIITGTILFVFVTPCFNQQILVVFLIIYYAVVLFSKWQFGSPAHRTLPIDLIKLDDKTTKSLQEIVLREYDYIQETMSQSMNDRHTLINYFLLSAGVLIAAIGVIYSDEGLRYSPYKNQITISICFIFSIVAWIYFLKIIRLRQAWCESCASMNRIKQFFLINAGLTDGHPGTPFLWKSSTLPRAAKKGSLFHFESILITFISSIAVAVTSILLQPINSISTSFWVPGIFFLYHFFLQYSSYTVFLEEKNKESGN